MRLNIRIAAAASSDGGWIGHARAGGGGQNDDGPLSLSINPQDTDAPALLMWTGKAIGTTPSLPNPHAILLTNFIDIGAENASEFNAWYDSEHLPRLSAVPGVARAMRYRATSGSPLYLAIFELSDARIAEGPEWLVAARTPWTARMKRLSLSYRSYMFVPV